MDFYTSAIGVLVRLYLYIRSEDTRQNMQISSIREVVVQTQMMITPREDRRQQNSKRNVKLSTERKRIVGCPEEEAD
jgi:hypothetical protein